MIYLDYNSTTPVLPEVFQAMEPYFCKNWGNPSSPYSFGKEAANAIEKARSQVASLIGAESDEIFFTSCATESNQTVLNSFSRVSTSAVEHSSIRDYLLNREKPRFIPVDNLGNINLMALEEHLDSEKPELLSIIWANNETGNISPIEDIGAICKKRDILFHSDAVQAAGKIGIDVNSTTVDFLSLSSHKIYGPKGIGALHIKKGINCKPLLVGSQEKGFRGGTESVPLIVGFGKAAELAKEHLASRAIHLAQMRDLLEKMIIQNIPGTYINGSPKNRLPNTSNIGFKGLDSEPLAIMLGNKDIMVSTGSACKSKAITPSHVLLAMGRDHSQANEAIRFSVSHLNTEAEITTAIQILNESIKLIR